MEDYVYIEPAGQHRQAFARWCLAQTPRIETASQSGSNVPLSLYPSVPEALLEGAYVDGFLYGVPAPQPKSEKAAQSPRRASRRRKQAVVGNETNTTEGSGE